MNEEEEKEKPKVEEKKEGKKEKHNKWWGKFFSKKSLLKQNKVAVIYLRNNGNAELLEVQTRNGSFNINGKPYHEDKDCIYTVKNSNKERIPLMVVEEWNLVPLGTKKRSDESMQQKFADLEKHVLSGIRLAELVKSGGKEGFEGKLTTKQIIVYGIIALVIGAVVISYI